MARSGYRRIHVDLPGFGESPGAAVIDGAGHNVSGERPDLLAALLGDWLDRVER